MPVPAGSPASRLGPRARDLVGRVAIVTGSASGIGAVTARALAEAGAAVVVADLPEAGGEDVVAAITDAGGTARSIPVDVTDEESVRSLVAQTVDAYGRLDVLDNNAAATHLTAQDGDVCSMSVDLWDRAMAVNARGPMLMCKHAIPPMVAGGGGSIVNISSALSLLGQLGNTAYAASKGALNSLTRHVATSHGHQGVRCNALAVGLSASRRALGSMPAEVLDIMVQSTLVGRLGDPLDIAEAVVFLASDRSAFLTGLVLPIDGGVSSHFPAYAQIRGLAARGDGG